MGCGERRLGAGCQHGVNADGDLFALFVGVPEGSR